MIKHLQANDITLGKIRENNPGLRVCITSILYNGKDSSKFTPVIFDTENEQHANKTVLAVGRATSAAPTYFEGSKIDGDKVYFDGGCYANNPSAWGLILALTKVKIDSIRVISIGTGYLDPQPKAKKPDQEVDEDDGYVE